MINLNDDRIIRGRNLLKNGAFSVVQGATSGNLTNSIALPTQSLGYLGEAEWWMTSITASSLPTYSISSLNQSVTFAGNTGVTGIYMGQRLESKDTNNIKNKTVTLSFETSNSLLTTMNWEVYRPTTSDDVHGTITTPTQTLIASGNITITSTLTRYQVSFALPDLASKGLEFRFYVGSQTSGTWVMSRLQLEEGSITTTFNCGDYPNELLRCQRYFWQISTPISAQGNASAGGASAFNSFLNPVQMHLNPVQNITTTGLANLSAFTLSTGIQNNTLQVVASGAGGFNGTISTGTFSAHIP